MSGEPVSSTAGASTIFLSPECPSRGEAHPNGQNALVKPIVEAWRGRYAPRSMLNDRSSILSLLETRRSGKPRELVGPGPTPEEMARILTIAARIPDHGTLTPWRFVTVADDQRGAFEALLQQALVEQEPNAPAAKHQKEHDFAYYQGALIMLISAPVQDHKIPVWEQ